MAGSSPGDAAPAERGGRAVPAPTSGSRGKGAVPVPRMPGYRAAARSSWSRSPPGIFPAIPGQRQLWRCLRQKPQPLLLPPPLRPIRSLLEPLEPPALTAPLRRDRGWEAGASLMSFSRAKRRDRRHHPHLAAGPSALTGHLSPARAPGLEAEGCRPEWHSASTPWLRGSGQAVPQPLRPQDSPGGQQPGPPPAVPLARL